MRRQFFRTMLTGGKISDNQPAPLKDEPGLDLNVEIDTVFGFYDATVKSLVLDAKRRGGKLTYLEGADGSMGRLRSRCMWSRRRDTRACCTSDAIRRRLGLPAHRFLSAARGGTMNLRVNLDGGSGAEKTGVLDIRQFEVVGDEIVGKVVSQAERERARLKPDSRGPSQQASAGDRMYFDRMVLPFATGANEFQIHDAAINGPLLGATMRGRIDFTHETLALSGTYIPFFGINNILQDVPILNELLMGHPNEGMFGITFAIHGSMAAPQTDVNPASVLAPGFLRQVFEYENRPQAAP